MCYSNVCNPVLLHGGRDAKCSHGIVVQHKSQEKDRQWINSAVGVDRAAVPSHCNDSQHLQPGISSQVSDPESCRTIKTHNICGFCESLLRSSPTAPFAQLLLLSRLQKHTMPLLQGARDKGWCPCGTDMSWRVRLGSGRPQFESPLSHARSFGDTGPGKHPQPRLPHWVVVLKLKQGRGRLTVLGELLRVSPGEAVKVSIDGANAQMLTSHDSPPCEWCWKASAPEQLSARARPSEACGSCAWALGEEKNRWADVIRYYN